jgi:MarR family transcriptional regulator, transcriptional regulator for hemolysin
MRADPEADLLFLLYEVALQMRTCADRMARTHGMTRAQWAILARLERQSDMSQNELAAMIEVAPISVARLVNRLEKIGVVERCPDPTDRRVRRLRLRPAAAPILREIAYYRTELHDRIAQGIDRTKLDATISSLRQMKANLSGARRPTEAAVQGTRPDVEIRKT